MNQIIKNTIILFVITLVAGICLGTVHDLSLIHIYTTHVKGFDAFYTSTYETGEKWLKAALEAGGYEVTFLPNHLANEEFPFTMEELKQYDLVILSDIGANTLLLPGATFNRSEKMPNRCNRCV